MVEREVTARLPMRLLAGDMDSMSGKGEREREIIAAASKAGRAGAPSET